MFICWDITPMDIFLMILAASALFLFIILRFYWRKHRRSLYLDKKFIKKRWSSIEDLLSYGKEMNYKLAIIEADKLLDYVLKEMHFNGETLADRLKLATFKYPKLRAVWWAHKVRNHVVHDVKYIVKPNETKKVVSLFKKALKELNAL